MRREDQRDMARADAVQALYDFGVMTVAADVVRPEVVGGFAEHQSELCLAARAGDAGFGIRDQMRRIDDARFHHWQKAELDRRRVAARVADDARLADRVPVHLREPVDRLGEEVGAGMRHLVPLLELRRILEPEIGGKVDDLRAALRELARLGHRDAVRRGEEDDFATLQVGLRRVAVLELGELRQAAQAGEHLGDRRPRLLAGGDRAQLRLRMHGEQAQQLDACIPGPADDADPDHDALADARRFYHPAGPIMTTE